MRRRALLAALAGTVPTASAGCVTDGSNGDDGGSGDTCDDVTVEAASVRVDYICDYGPRTDGDVRGSAADCDDELTVQLLDGGTVVEVRTVDAAPEWTADFEVDAPIDPGEATVRVRGANDAVLADRSVTVEHYLDVPHLSIWNPGVDPETATVGEAVTASLTVGNVGGAGEFEATFLVDEQPAASETGTVESATDCDRASGPAVELAHAFESAGEYEVGLALATEDPAGSGGEVELGTVSVAE